MARPSTFKAEYAEQARKICLLGATDAQLADFFKVTERTINAWKLQHPTFAEALRAGKEQADALVAHSLYRRALGFKHPAVKILTVADGSNQGSHVEEVAYTEIYPPDTTACIFWLKNRRPDVWRDRQQHEVTGKDGGPVETKGVITWGTTEIPL